MAVLARNVIVDGKPYLKGTTPPDEIADKIREPRNWVGGVAPDLSTAAPEKVLHLDGLPRTKILDLLGLDELPANPHASTHAAGQTDPVALSQAQVTGLVSALAGKVDEGSLVVNVRDHGAVGDGVTDDLAAFNAALTAAGNGRVFIPQGVYLLSASPSFSGNACSFGGVGEGTVLRGSGSGPVLDFTGWAGPGQTVGNFSVEGTNTAGQTTNVGIKLSAPTSQVGFKFHDIRISKTGGTGFDFGSAELADFERIVVTQPVGALANNVPYFRASGAFNGNRVRGCGVLSLSNTANMGAGGAVVIADNGTFAPHGNSFEAWWAQSMHPSTGQAIFSISGNDNTISDLQFFDCSKVTGATGTAHVRFLPPGVNNLGGNVMTGVIPGRDPGVPTSIDVGVDMQQTRNRVAGVKGYRGTNVVLASGVANTHVDIGGAAGAALDPTVVDNSGSTSNVVIDSYLNDWRLGTAAVLRFGASGPSVRSGTGTPEGSVTAAVGSTYHRTDGIAGTTFYVKESGTGNTGWVAQQARLFVNVKDFGALGNNTGNDATAIQAAIDSLPTSGTNIGGVVYVPRGTYRLTAPVILKPGVRLAGESQYASRLVSASGAGVITWTAVLHNVVVENMYLTGASGHIFAPTGDFGIHTVTVRNCQIVQQDTTKSIMNHVGAGDYIQVVFTNCNLVRSAGATVPAFNIINSNGGANQNQWSDCWAHSNGTSSAPFFRIESTSTQSYSYDNVFKRITGEQNQGGLIHLYNSYGAVIEGVVDWDQQTAYTDDLFKFGSSASASSFRTRYTTITNSGRRGGTLGSGVYDINLVPGQTSRCTLIGVNHSSEPTSGLRINMAEADAHTLIGVPPLGTVWATQPSGVGHFFGTAAKFGSAVHVGNSAEPATPASGSVLFAAGDVLKTKNSSGVVAPIGRNDQVINVKDYGAIGDGVADDTAAVQAALTAAGVGTLTTYGRKLVFPAGRFKITDTLFADMPVGMEVEGGGRNVTYLVATSAMVGKPVIKVQDYYQISFRNLTIQGAGGVNAPSAAINSHRERNNSTSGGLVNQKMHATNVSMLNVARGIDWTYARPAADGNNDQATITNCAVSNFTVAAYDINGVNPVWIRFLGGEIGVGPIAWRMTGGGSFQAIGTIVGALTDVEIDVLAGNYIHPTSIIGVGGEDAGSGCKMIRVASGATGFNINYVGYERTQSAPNKMMIDFQGTNKSSLQMTNCYMDLGQVGQTAQFTDSTSTARFLNCPGLALTTISYNGYLYLHNNRHVPGTVTLTDLGSGKLSQIGDTGGGFSAALSQSTQVQTYTTSQSITVPTGCKAFAWRFVGSTGGGGSGGRAPANTAVSGGASAGGAGYAEGRRAATGNCAPGSTLTLTIGAAGVGGPAITTDNTAGSPGTAAGTSLLTASGTLLANVFGSGGGTGGGIGTGGTAGAAGDSMFIGAAGSGTLATGAQQVTAQNARAGGPGGGPGGGITSANVAANGGNSGVNLGHGTGTQSAGGVVGGASPVTSADPTHTVAAVAGGGGAASLTTAAQDGADAGMGGGAGGGGASRDGHLSGKGGNGRTGQLEMTWMF